MIDSCVLAMFVNSTWILNGWFTDTLSGKWNWILLLEIIELEVVVSWEDCDVFVSSCEWLFSVVLSSVLFALLLPLWLPWFLWLLFSCDDVLP